MYSKTSAAIVIQNWWRNKCRSTLKRKYSAFDSEISEISYSGISDSDSEISYSEISESEIEINDNEIEILKDLSIFLLLVGTVYFVIIFCKQ